LAEQAAAQRDERAKLDMMKAEMAKAEAEFLQRQHERFLQFSAVLNAARGSAPPGGQSRWSRPGRE
jgi:hypothetical protein